MVCRWYNGLRAEAEAEAETKAKAKAKLCMTGPAARRLRWPSQ